MDSRTLTSLPRYMLYCALVTSLTSFSIGYVIGAPNIPESAIRGKDGECGAHPYTIQGGFPNCFEFSDITWGFAVGAFCLGACGGGLVGGSIQNKLGRIKTMFLSNMVFILGSLILGFTFHQAQFIVGRIVIGLACGLGGVVAPTYLGEISTIEARGTLGTFHQLFLVMGVVVSTLIGLVWNVPPGWRITMALNGVPALIQCFMLPTLIESPRYLVSKRLLQEAQRSLQRLRGPEKEVDILPEFKGIMTVKNELTIISAPEHSDTSAPPTSNHQQPYGIMDLFRSECRGLALLGIMVHFFQQASGINGLTYYSTSFLATVFGSNNSKFITVGVFCCSLTFTVVSLHMVRRFNRKTLMVTSLGGLSFSSILLVIGSYASINILVVVAVFLYIASFAFALGSIPWLLLSELVPTYALSPASSVATGVNWGTNFIVGLVFPSMTKALGSATFIVFAATNLAGALFVWYFVPETRGRTVDAVMAEKGVRPRS
ncbi:general substrate transporter [Mortierella sp. GBAus27b]|nr:general substrate transporter [Mortierella sp. GBAus27b]